MNEELTIRKKTNKTKNIDISLAQDPKYSDDKIETLLNDLETCSNPTIAKSLMLKFLNKEYKIR